MNITVERAASVIRHIQSVGYRPDTIGYSALEVALACMEEWCKKHTPKEIGFKIVKTVNSEKNKDWKIAYDNLLNDYFKLKRDNEQKHGHWIVGEYFNDEIYGGRSRYDECSKCGYKHRVSEPMLTDAYCACCGAKMDEEVE